MKLNLHKSFLTAAVIACAGTALATSGGPDAYGYTFRDSNEPNGPTFNWIEIATPAGGSGTLRTAVQCDDCHEGNVALGFNFPFYGVNQNQISIASNGTIYFENVYLGLSNNCIPGTPGYGMTQYNFIAHMWDDVDAGSQGGIYTQAFPEYFIIEYYDLTPCCGAGDGDTWQIILFKNGNILLQYKELSNIGLQTDKTIGIQNDPATGLQYYCEGTGDNIASNRAILFTPPTFTCDTVSQNILPANISICSGAPSVILNAGTNAATTWSTAETTSAINVTTPGSYSVIVLDTNGCTLKDTVMVNIATSPAVNLGTDFSACSSAMLDAGNAGAAFVWSDMSINQTLTVTLSGTYTVEVTDVTTGCANSDTINVTINDLPVVTLNLSGDTLCVNSASVTLSGGLPSGGSYTGTGVSAGVFDPAVAGAGTHTITYAFTDVNGCTNSVTENMIVSTCLSISNITANAFNVYPNPTNGMLYIEAPFAGTPVEVINVYGKTVLSQQMLINKVVIDMNAYENGVYFVRTQNSVHKIVLQK